MKHSALLLLLSNDSVSLTDDDRKYISYVFQRPRDLKLKDFLLKDTEQQTQRFSLRYKTWEFNKSHWTTSYVLNNLYELICNVLCWAWCWSEGDTWSETTETETAQHHFCLHVNFKYTLLFWNKSAADIFVVLTSCDVWMLHRSFSLFCVEDQV